MTDKSIARHTAGPWPVPHFARDDIKCNCTGILAGEFCGAIGDVFFDNGKRIADGGNDCPPLAEAKANAHLIAAAPDLLEALQCMVKQFTKARSTLKDSEARCKAHAAIQKATGVRP